MLSFFICSLFQPICHFDNYLHIVLLTFHITIITGVLYHFDNYLHIVLLTFHITIITGVLYHFDNYLHIVILMFPIFLLFYYYSPHFFLGHHVFSLAQSFFWSPLVYLAAGSPQSAYLSCFSTFSSTVVVLANCSFVFCNIPPCCLIILVFSPIILFCPIKTSCIIRPLAATIDCKEEVWLDIISAKSFFVISLNGLRM